MEEKIEFMQSLGAREVLSDKWHLFLSHFFYTYFFIYVFGAWTKSLTVLELMI